MHRAHPGASVPALIAALTALLVLSACGGGSDDDSALDAAQESAAPDAAAEEKALTTLANALWDAREAAENSGDTSPGRFQGILTPALVESEVAKLESYEELDLTRRGGPEVTAIEPTVSGSTATVWMCLDEDEWTAFEGDQAVDRQELGPQPFGFDAEKTDDQWVVASFKTPEDAEGEKSC